jgi:NAD(P)-dependent dehydrogenase (short-subunit alcohol dehydrogenase family)
MTHVANKVVAVTGAASGIGRALAMHLTKQGAHVALADVNAPGLEETARMLGNAGVKVTTHLVDVRSRDAVYAFAADVERQHGGADVIVNNAGLTVRASLESVTYDDFELVVGVNMWGVIYGCKAFLPLFRKRGAGHIVNISSINAMVPFRENGPYNISKYAVLGLSETLAQELQGEPIHVTCVHPGGIRTNIVRNARGHSESDAALFDKIARTSAEEAAAAIAHGIEKNKEQVFIGLDAKALATAKRLAPHWIVHQTASMMRRLDRRRAAAPTKPG